jgi:hypothetical protein
MMNVTVSVIVPMIREDLQLDACLESLVYQTCKNTEILLVAPAGDSWAQGKMHLWDTRFPKKIRMVRIAGDGLAQARNAGIREARGEYVLFADTCDWLDYKAADMLYACAQKNEADMVISAVWQKMDNGMERRAVLPEQEHPYTIAAYLNADQLWFLHGKLFRRSLFERFGLLPELACGSEATWLYPAISQGIRVSYLRRSLYYRQAPEKMTVTSAEDCLQSFDMLLKNTAPDYRLYALGCTMQQALQLAQRDPVHSRRFAQWYEAHVPEAEKVLAAAGDESSALRLKAALSANVCFVQAEERVPARVFINALRSGDGKERFAGAFGEETEIVLLSATQETLAVAPAVVQQAFEAGDMDFVGRYLAAKACYEQGGVYVDEDMILKAPLDVLRNDPAFFGYESNESFTERIFGCRRGNPVFGRLVASYEVEELAGETVRSLAERIRMVAVGMAGAPLRSGYYDLRHRGLCLYPVSMFVSTQPFLTDLSLSCYKPELFEGQECVTIPAKLVRLQAEAFVQQEDQRRGIPQIRKDHSWLQNRVKGLDNERIRLQNSVASLEKNRDWMQGKLDYANSERSRLAENVASLEKNRDWMQGKLDYANSERGRLQGCVNSLEKDCAGLQERVDGLIKDCNWLSDKSRRLGTELDDYKSRFLVRVAWKVSSLFRKKS